jgi:hypothetical protein
MVWNLVFLFVYFVDIWFFMMLDIKSSTDYLSRPGGSFSNFSMLFGKYFCFWNFVLLKWFWNFVSNCGRNVPENCFQTASLKNENAWVNGKYRLRSKRPKKLSQRIETFDLIEKKLDTNVFLVCLKNWSIFETNGKTLVSNVYLLSKMFDSF